MTSSDNFFVLKIVEKTFETLESDGLLDFEKISKHLNIEPAKVAEVLRGLVGEGHPLGFMKVSLGLAAVNLGAEPEKIAKHLSWREMENFVAHACFLSGYFQKQGLRLSFRRKRAEIDVLAASPSLCLVFDCKRWNKRLAGKTLNAIVEKHKRRTYAVKSYLQENMPGNKLVFFAPIIVSLYEPSSRKVSDVYIVPVNSLKSFLQSAENVLAGEVYAAHLDKKWLEFFTRHNLNQSLEKVR